MELTVKEGQVNHPLSFQLYEEAIEVALQRPFTSFVQWPFVATPFFIKTSVYVSK